ncbi:RiPP maturation radical SAM C-methyltransferase [Micromonospora sp. DT233]|uniref:RiPP maturation radical SAM C-methyltransferase n=1 Tax=Micromonospora sp. DT233 TaxID=3393432 RepID=UPI003CED95D4
MTTSAVVPSSAVKLRVLLVCMPWASLDMPSLALSTIRPLADASPDVESVSVRYGNLEWADHVLAASAGRIDEQAYDKIARGDYVAMGEWIFSSALYGPEPAEQTPFYRASAANGADPTDLAHAVQMYGLAPDFVRQLAREVVADAPHVVGLTSTFDQNIPSIALAAEIKRLDPGITVILGGANCDGVQGEALHRNFPALDHVVRGEAELVFPKLLQALSGAHGGSGPGADPVTATRLAAIPGLCWRTDDGTAVANRLGHTMVPMTKVPHPDFSDYFRAFHNCAAVREVLPKVQVEGGRGCWWGEKHHCTFCGLNGSLMTHRSKPAERVLAEISSAVQRHRVLDVVFADNILDMGYLKTLLPQLGELGWDLRMFFEVKSNLTYPQLQGLADSGVTQIQPGIENLSSRVLKLMRKGVSGWQNIRLLRDCRTLAIYPGWNLLYGFPGETEQDYDPLLRQLDNLTHLFPPERVGRIMLTRFSPYFDDPSLGMRNEGPSRLLSHVYRLPADELRDLVYIFDSADAGIPRDVAGALEEGVSRWQQSHPGARLVSLAEGDGLRIIDERRRGTSREHLLSDPVQVAAYRALLKGRSFRALLDQLRAATGVTPSEDAVRQLLDDWLELGLVFREGDHHVALATGLGYR